MDLPSLFFVPQLRCVCSKVRQLSTNALVDTVLTKLKYKPSQNQAQLHDLSESMERIRKEKLIKGRPPAIKITPEKEKEDIEIVEDVEDDESSK
jgi:2-C-methyl-D-erythritol 4-phosphate cytidylyltransferase